MGLVSTSFVAMGEPDQVVGYLAHVAAQLGDPPVQRLEHELRVLEVEAEGRAQTRLGFDLSVRFGPQGAGLLAWPEYGFRILQADDIVQWARTWFTRHNAALWLPGPPPAGFQLKDLPPGELVERQPCRSLVDRRVSVGADTRTSSLSMLSYGDRWGMGPPVHRA